VTLYTEGFSRFVTSTTAPIATGRSESCRVGLSPTGKSRLSTAHVEDGFEISGASDFFDFADFTQKSKDYVDWVSQLQTISGR
jgi:hypothetical protein